MQVWMYQLAIAVFLSDSRLEIIKSAERWTCILYKLIRRSDLASVAGHTLTTQRDSDRREGGEHGC